MSNLPAVPSAPQVEGLEDFDATDMVMPKLDIAHTDGQWVDSLSGEKFDNIEVILLGLIKQRILWPTEMAAEKEAPLCKSYNFTEGRPDPVNPSRFPWKSSGFAMSDYVDGENPPAVSCEGCALKEWGSNPKGDTPWCSEQHTFAILLPIIGGGWSPAVMTLQRTGIKPSKAYMTAFARSQSPLFVTTTKLGLTVQKRGTVTFSVPTFERGTPTDQADHASYAAQYRHIREFIGTPRAAEAEEGTPVASPQPTATKSAPADDEMPF